MYLSTQEESYEIFQKKENKESLLYIECDQGPPVDYMYISQEPVRWIPNKLILIGYLNWYTFPWQALK